jgi:hypothetical protein
MRHPSQPEENMMAAVLLSVSEDAVRFGMAMGCFHGFEFRAARLNGRYRPGVSTRVSVVVRQDGTLIDTFLIDATVSTGYEN